VALEGSSRALGTTLQKKVVTRIPGGSRHVLQGLCFGVAAHASRDEAEPNNKVEVAPRLLLAWHGMEWGQRQPTRSYPSIRRELRCGCAGGGG
jgi:hypothetical protein